MKRQTRHLAAAAALAGTALLTTACAGGAGGAAPPPSAEGAVDSTGRLAVAYANGVAVLDGGTLTPVDEFATEEFVRVNDFGDGRTIAVTTSKGFQLLDTAAPALTDLTVGAKTPGHVVVHHGKTVLFDDGTGRTTILDTGVFGAGYETLPEGDVYTSPKAHHGVSIVLEDDTLLTTVGDDSGRTGAVALHAHDGHWDVAATGDQCPGIHGEGTAKGEAVVFGCEDGALLYRDGGFTKLTAPDAYGRMGNAFVSETSPLVVGDYKRDPDAEGYLLNAVTLIDTAAGTLDVVDLPKEVQYTFRGVARGPKDLAYILATDGSIHVLDPSGGQITDSFPVVGAWQGPARWQDPHPAIKVDGDTAYVTEPATNSIHAVDLTTGDVTATVELPYTPNEIAIALG
ncbi:DNA-binding beta-propeller fold protein YncE [Microbacterium resistens]|uniref:DNA-binding beta-propeller fold protein YncE n=1 Tax=Microbacterium resistens TaxID=156977 RepID=A0ABU1SCY1_9MICO|nr:zinc metallochaperone AztD [Microbacterium resistens]MDR6867463.1 DNA-binding beta-propeller fold protein YncE [Microbacterium resistens]